MFQISNPQAPKHLRMAESRVLFNENVTEHQENKELVRSIVPGAERFFFGDGVSQPSSNCHPTSRRNKARGGEATRCRWCRSQSRIRRDRRI